MDSQLTEIIGRHRLVEQLIAAGFEVAYPHRDKGIDLIAYDDRDSFRAFPIQLKAATKANFSIDAKYAKAHGLVLSFVWNIGEPDKTVTYALTYAEVLDVATAMGWTKTESWKKGIYSTTAPSQRLLALLEKHKMTSEKWRKKLLDQKF